MIQHSACRIVNSSVRLELEEKKVLRAVIYIISRTLSQVRKLRHGEVKWLAQDLTGISGRTRIWTCIHWPQAWIPYHYREWVRSGGMEGDMAGGEAQDRSWWTLRQCGQWGAGRILNRGVTWLDMGPFLRFHDSRSQEIFAEWVNEWVNVLPKPSMKPQSRDHTRG